MALQERGAVAPDAGWGVGFGDGGGVSGASGALWVVSRETGEGERAGRLLCIPEVLGFFDLCAGRLCCEGWDEGHFGIEGGGVRVSR